jgi:hypothetical protein
MSKREVAKDFAVGGLAVGAAFAGSGALAAAAIPAGAAVLIQAVRDGYGAFRERRVTKWIEYLLEGDDDPKAFTDKVIASLYDEQDVVASAFVQGARSAMDAIDPAALPILGLLSRMYLRHAAFPAWFYRGATNLVSGLTAADVGILRRLLKDVSSFAPASEHLQLLSSGDALMVASEGQHDARSLAPLSEARRLFTMLKQHGLGHSSGAYGVGGSPDALVIHKDVVGWLITVIPH